MAESRRQLPGPWRHHSEPHPAQVETLIHLSSGNKVERCHFLQNNCYGQARQRARELVFLLLNLLCAREASLGEFCRLTQALCRILATLLSRHQSLFICRQMEAQRRRRTSPGSTSGWKFSIFNSGHSAEDCQRGARPARQQRPLSPSAGWHVFPRAPIGRLLMRWRLLDNEAY